MTEMMRVNWPEHLAKFAYEGVTHAGLAIVAADSGLVLLAQRAPDPTDDPEVAETWEFPGGGLEEGEDPLAAGFREFAQEVGLPLPEGEVVNGWRAGPEDNYQGFVYRIDTAFPLETFVPNGEVQDLRWFSREQASAFKGLRPEMRNFDWTVLDEAVSGNEEMAMDEQVEAAQVGSDPEYLRVDEQTGEEVGRAVVADEDEEPILTLADLAIEPIPVHGVLAPEDVESGDRRGFNAGAMTARPYRLPFMWQEQQEAGHDKAWLVGSVDRLMRKDGLIHWEGALMPTSQKASEFAEVLEFFGRFGVSVDGDKGNMDTERTNATSVMWYDAVRAAGLTAVSIPAFAEAYVAFGRHPDMPDEDTEEFAVMRASGDAVTFDRGPGWVTHPKETKRIHDYWTKPGQPGYQKIRWGTPGDFRRARVLIGEKIGLNSPSDLRYLNQIIAQWHYDALGYWPGELGKPGNAPATPENRRRAARHAASLGEVDLWEPVLSASGEVLEQFRDVPTEERKRLADEGKAMSDGSFPIANEQDLRNAIQAIGRAKDPDAAKRHIRKRARALGKEDLIPDTWGAESFEFTLDALTASSAPAVPPASYFERHPDTGATVIEEPDESGIRRTYGYAAEWGVCHIGYDGRCVEVPGDPTGEGYPEFHLGRTKTTDGYIATGLITYKVEHRDHGRILTETAQQAHFDNVANAWAAVRLGEDERGVWFSGVVLPHVPDEDIVLIEAAGQVSGEWKYGALRGLQSVNIPGFPVQRASAAEFDENGEVTYLVASAHGDAVGECEPSPAEKMAALRQVDAEVRFQKLRSEWEGRL